MTDQELIEQEGLEMIEKSLKDHTLEAGKIPQVWRATFDGATIKTYSGKYQWARINNAKSAIKLHLYNVYLPKARTHLDHQTRNKIFDQLLKSGRLRFVQVS